MISSSPSPRKSEELSGLCDHKVDGGSTRSLGTPPRAEAAQLHQLQERAGSQATGRHWIILGGPHHDEETLKEVFTVGDRPAIFSFREEAEAFLRARGPGAGWRVEELGTEEFVSMLRGPLSGFGRLVLDPLSEVENRAVDSLVSVGREEFLGLLAHRSRPLSLRSVED